jgi:ubiquinone/menaquinone biosynthesis C-methylase UbiE
VHIGNHRVLQDARLCSPAMQRSRFLCEEAVLKIRPYLSRYMNILELACGKGELSFSLAGYTHLWEATDLSPAMIAQAKQRHGSCRLHFSVQDAANLPYAPYSFDAVLLANALQTMPRAEKALQEIKRVLKPGGLLIAPTFVRREGAAFCLRTRLMKQNNWIHAKWNAEEFLEYLHAHGFSAVEAPLLGGGPAPLCCAITKEEVVLQHDRPAV